MREAKEELKGDHFGEGPKVRALSLLQAPERKETLISLLNFCALAGLAGVAISGLSFAVTAARIGIGLVLRGI